MQCDDVLLQVAIADSKAILILSLIDKADIFDEVVSGIIENIEIELTADKKTIKMQDKGRTITYKGSMKEYRYVSGDASFVMVDPIKFYLEFGSYRYEGYFPKGTRDEIEKVVKEVIFVVGNTITVGKLPTQLGMHHFTLTGIKDIVVRNYTN